MAQAPASAGLALLLHPEDALGTVLAATLAGAGFAVRRVSAAVGFASAVAGDPPELAVVATEPGWARGEDLAEALRERWPSVPLVFVGPVDRPGLVRAAVALRVLDLLPPTLEGVAALGPLLEQGAAELPDPHAAVPRAAAVRAGVDGRSSDAHRGRIAALEAELQTLRGRAAVAGADARHVHAQLAAELAHDFHQPLRSLRRLSERLEDRLVQAGDAEGRTIAQGLSASATRLRGLVDGLLADHAPSASPSAEPPADTADADRVLDQVLAALAAAIDDTGAIVTRGPLPELALPPHLLHRILQNLVANAIQHGGDPPEVHIVAERAGERHWDLCVRDNGPGMPTEVPQQPRGATAGHGLGLRIVRRLVDRAGGELWLEPATPGGTLARVRLPGDPALLDDAPTVVEVPRRDTSCESSSSS